MASHNKESVKYSSNSFQRFQRGFRLKEPPPPNPRLTNDKVNIMHQEIQKVIQIENKT